MRTAASGILLFGGTTEGRLLAEYISGLGCSLLVCVATDYGRELLPPQIPVRTGRLDAEGIKELIEKERPGLIIDATHPYAVEITENIEEARKASGGIPLLKCRREKGRREAGDKRCLPGGVSGSQAHKGPDILQGIPRVEGESPLPQPPGLPHESTGGEEPGVVTVPNLEAAVRLLSRTRGNVLVTTGSKELAAYSLLEDYRSRLYVRVLPAAPALEACRQLGIEEGHIIAAQGPFSLETNRRQLREYNCSFLVTKDGGAAGGFQEKLWAARAEGAVAVVIERPGGNQGLSLEEIMRLVKEWTEQKGG